MCIRIYCVGFSPQRSALTLVVMVHPPSIIIYIDAFVFSPRYKKGTFPFAANGRAMSVNETEGMIKVRVAWMRGGCVCMNCMRARACVNGVCVRVYLNLAFTYPTPSSPHSPIHLHPPSTPPPLHASTSPPLRLSASPPLRATIKVLAHGETDQILGIHIIGANAGELIAEGVLAMEYVLRHTPYGIRPTPYALCVSVSVLVLVSVSVSTWLNRAERG